MKLVMTDQIETTILDSIHHTLSNKDKFTEVGEALHAVYDGNLKMAADDIMLDLLNQLDALTPNTDPIYQTMMIVDRLVVSNSAHI